MAFSPTVIKELRRELTVLERERLRAEARVRAIRMILAIRQEPTREPPALRRRILSLLQHTAGGSTPAGLTRRLEQSGVQVGGTTPLRERVAHELSRMRRVGIVQRTPQGRYELRADSAPGSAPVTVAPTAATRSDV